MIATVLLRVEAVTKDAFPTSELSVNMIDKAWAEALQSRPVYEPDAEVQWYVVVSVISFLDPVF